MTLKEEIIANLEGIRDYFWEEYAIEVLLTNRKILQRRALDISDLINKIKKAEVIENV